MEKRGWLDAVSGPGSGLEDHPGLSEPRSVRSCGWSWRGQAAAGCDVLIAARHARATTRGGGSGGIWTHGAIRPFLVCDVPRMRCREHGVVTMQVPWAEGSSRYTAEFEAEAIRWLKEASVQAVAQRMRLSWNAADGIMQRAVARGAGAPPGAGRCGTCRWTRRPFAGATST